MSEQKAKISLACAQYVLVFQEEILVDFLREFGEYFSSYDLRRAEKVPKPGENCSVYRSKAHIKITVRVEQRKKFLKFIKNFFKEKGISLQTIK